MSKDDFFTFNIKRESENGYSVEYRSNIHQREKSIKWYKKYLANNDMQLVPLGMIMRGPGWQYDPKDDTAKPLSYGEYRSLGIVISLALPNGEEPAEWLVDILKRIETFALSELDKVPSEPKEHTA